MHDTPIIARRVHKAYRRGRTQSPVLLGVDLTVERGECVFLAGPSGSGKTTLLSILGCILTPDEGEVRILGHDPAALDDRGRAALRRDSLGFVFQRFQLVRGLTARDNVAVPLSLQGHDVRSARRRANELLDRVGLCAQAGNTPDRLSTGQCQRVALARALANDPELVLADEPTASLDAQNGLEVMRLLRDLTSGGKTVIVVTHDERIFPFADRVCRMENGRVVAADCATRAPTAAEAVHA